MSVGEIISHVEDRSRGGTSATNGAHELMLHRRLLHDDAEGVHEPLNESTIIRTKSAAIFELIENSPKQFRTLSQLINSVSQPVTFSSYKSLSLCYLELQKVLTNGFPTTKQPSSLWLQTCHRM